jgi:hypothetical protein
MACHIDLPEIRFEDVATPSTEPVLGFGGPVESRVSVGRSDVVPVTPDDVVTDPQLATYLKNMTSRSLVRMTLRMSLRPATGERFTRAMFSVRLFADEGPPEAQPIARLLVPERLTAGSITQQSGMTLALSGGVPGAADANVGVSSQTTSELQRYYVYSQGDGESDPEWRYQVTESMPALEGSFTMGLIAEVTNAFDTNAQLDVTGTVRRRLRSTDISWTPVDGIERFPIFAPTT